MQHIRRQTSQVFSLNYTKVRIPAKFLKAMSHGDHVSAKMFVWSRVQMYRKTKHSSVLKTILFSRFVNALMFMLNRSFSLSVFIWRVKECKYKIAPSICLRKYNHVTTQKCQDKPSRLRKTNNSNADNKEWWREMWWRWWKGQNNECQTRKWMTIKRTKISPIISSERWRKVGRSWNLYFALDFSNIPRSRNETPAQIFA